MKETHEGRDAAIIGKVTKNHGGRVTVRGEFGSRVVSKLSGAELPRIC